MMKTLSAHTPRSTESGAIDLIVLFEEIGQEIPFTAHQDDTEEHGRDLYARALSGEFGPVAPYVAPAETFEQAERRLQSVVQAHQDAAAQARGFDNIRSAVSYADEPAVPSFQADGQAFRAWRSLEWAHCYQVLAEVRAGRRPIPTEAELLAELPPLVLP